MGEFVSIQVLKVGVCLYVGLILGWVASKMVKVSYNLKDGLLQRKRPSLIRQNVAFRNAFGGCCNGWWKCVVI